MSMEKLEPVGDRILVEPHEQGGERKTKGGIVIPDVKEAQNTSGVVKAVGPGKMMETGLRSTMEFEVGDTVLYGKFAGVKVPYDEQEYLFLRESDIIAKVRE